MQSDNTKQCTKCMLPRPLGEFLTGRNRNWCIWCRSLYQKEYYIANREALIEYQKAYASENKDTVAAARKIYSDAHKEEQAERSRRWYEANREKAIAAATTWVAENLEKRQNYRKEYWKKNRDRIRGKHRQYYQANKTAVARRNREWAKANPDASTAIKQRNKGKRKEAEGSYTGAEWTALKKRFQNRCVCCGNKHSKDDPFSKITPDHVVPLARGGTNFIDNLQPMCCHCNSKKSAHHTTDYRKSPFTGTGQMKLIG